MHSRRVLLHNPCQPWHTYSCQCYISTHFILARQDWSTVNTAGGLMAATADDVDGRTMAQAGTEVRSGSGAAVQVWQRASFLELAALPTAVPCGRLHTKHVLREWNLTQLAEDAEMLVSELLTNAVKASSAPQAKGLVALRLLAGQDPMPLSLF